MEVQTALQPKCDKKKVGQTKTLSAFKKSWQSVVQAIKTGLGYVLMNPATWRLLTVLVPDWVDKSWQFLKDVVSFFTDWN